MTSLFDNEKQSMTEDPLHLIMEILGYNYIKWTRQILTLITVAMATIQGFIIASIYLVLDGHNYRQYIPCIFLPQPAFVASIATMQFIRNLKNIKSTLAYYWSINSAGKRMENIIIRDSTYLKVFVIFMLVFSIITHLIFVLPIVGDEENIDSMTLLSTTYFPAFVNAKHFIFVPVVMIIGYLMVYPIILILYVTHMISFQQELLNEHLQRISEGYEDVEGFQVLYNEEYQRNIYQRLVICIEHYSNIRRSLKFYVDSMKLAMLYIPVGSITPGLTSYFIIYGISPQSNFRMILIMMLFCLIVVSLSVGGQRTTDNNSKFCDILMNCPWLYWNTKNRKALLLLQTVSLKPLTFSSYTSIELNFRLLLLFQKWSYAVVTILYKFSP